MKWWYWLILGIVTLSTGIAICIPAFDKRYSFSSTFLNEKTGSPSALLDDIVNATGSIISGDSVYWENTYARLEVYPHTSNDMITQTQYANLTWKKPDNTIDVAFCFDFPLTTKNIWLWRNISHPVKVPIFVNYTENITVTNILFFSEVTEAPEYVDYGDIDSLYFARLNASFDGVTQKNFTVGYDLIEWLDHKNTEAEITYDYLRVDHYDIQEEYYFDWDPINSMFNHVEYNSKHYYYIKEFNVVSGRTYQLKWSYDVPYTFGGSNSGKWELLAKLSSDSLQTAYSTGRYIKIDPWWNAAWTYRKLITINQTKVESTLTNFPVLISIIDTDLQEYARSDGYDICFVSYADNSTKYNHQIERYDSATGTLVAWVNITSLSGSVDTKVWIYYGNSGASNQQDIQGTWDSYFISVYHLNEASGGTGAIKDSTDSYVNGTTSAGGLTYSQTGVVGRCIQFTRASSGKIDFGTPSAWDVSAVTIEAWAKTSTDVSGTDMRVVAASNSATYKWLMTQNSISPANHLALSNSALTHATKATANTVNDGSWHYYYGVRSSETLYENMATQSSTVTDSWSWETACIGSKGTAYYYDGYIDEVRLSSTTRSRAWINATYNTISDPESFFYVGDQEMATATEVDPISPYWQNTSIVDANVTSTGETPDNVTLWYRWSTDNSSWDGGDWGWINDTFDSYSSDVDSSADKGSETSPTNAQETSRDSDYMTIQETDYGTSEVSESKAADGFTNTYYAWTETGSTPYLSADDGTNYITVATAGADEAWFTFADTTATGSGFTVNLYTDFDAGDGDDDCNWYIDVTGDNTAEYSGTYANPTTSTVSASVGTLTAAQINAARVWYEEIKGGSKTNTMTIDYAYLSIYRAAAPNYCNDHEYQFTSALTNRDVNTLCIYVNAHTGSETMNLNYRNGGSWTSLGTITSTGWKNVTATGIASTYTIQLIGATETSDTSQDSWTIDCIYLQQYNNTGGPYGCNWMIWDSPSYNPDEAAPWTFPFNCTNGTGYYEFYSRGNLSGTLEAAPGTADAICHVNYTEGEAVNRTNTQVFNKWLLCGNTSVRQNTEIFNKWILCGNDSARANFQVFNKWILCSNDTTRMNTQIFNRWLLCSNDTTRENTLVFNKWILCGNDSARSNFEVFNKWILCGNDSVRENTQVFNKWMLCGNDSSRSNTQVFNRWLLCGNATARSNTLVFNRWLLCGNDSTRMNTQVFNRWILCGNDTGRSNFQVFNRWILCGNDSTRMNTQIFNRWLLCGNATARSNFQVFNRWLLCGNDTERENTLIFDRWILCGNDSVRSNLQVFNRWLLCGNDTSRVNYQVFNRWLLCGNSSSRSNTQIFNRWLLCGNITFRENIQVFNKWLLCGNDTERANFQVFNKWLQCGNDTERVNTEIFNRWLLCGNDSTRSNTLVFNRWLLCGNTTNRVNTQVFNLWLLCGNDTIRSNYQVFNKWLLCGNDSSRSNTEIFNRWLLCGNDSFRVNTQVFNKWLQCGNDLVRENTLIFDRWLLCGNDSTRMNTQIFNRWILCGNDSSRINYQVFNRWLLCGNDSSGRINTLIFDRWLQCGNDTARENTLIFNRWLLCGNDTSRSSYEVFNKWLLCGNDTTRSGFLVFDRWLQCGNDSSRSNHQVFNRWLQCGNFTVRYNYMVMDRWLLCGNDSVRENTQVFNRWIICGNLTGRSNTLIFDRWLRCGNTSWYIVLSDEHPIDESTVRIRVTENVSLHASDVQMNITRENVEGSPMNTTIWFDGVLLFTNISFGNGTIEFWLFDYYPGTLDDDATYNWTVNATDTADPSHYLNETYTFTMNVVSGAGTGLTPMVDPRQGMYIGLIFIAFLCGTLVLRRKRKRR